MGIAELAGLLGTYDVVLTDGAALAEALNVRHARGALTGAGGARPSLGEVAWAFRHWVERLWRLLRPDVAIVDGFERRALLLRTQGARPDERDARWVVPLGRLVGRHNGTDRWERTVRAGELPADLAPAERGLLLGLGAYDEGLGRMGRVEPGDAARAVATALGAGRLPTVSATSIAYLSDEPLPPAVGAFAGAFTAFAGRRFEHLGADGTPFRDPGPATGGVPRGRDLLTVHPSSRRAQLVHALREIGVRVDRGPVRVASRDPLATYGALAPLLARGVPTARGDVRPVGAWLRATRPRARTGFGRHHLARLNVRLGSRNLAYEGARSPWWVPWDKASATDALLIDREAHSRAPLWDRDAEWRQRRLVPRPGELRSPGFERDGRWVREWEEARELLATREAFLGELGWEPEERERILGALLGEERVRVSVSTAVDEGPDGPEVEFCGLTDALEPSPDPPATLILLDLDAESFGAPERGDALDGLAERLGLEVEDPLARAARRWRRLLSLPTEGIVLSCPRLDEDGNELRPCEFLAALEGSPDGAAIDGAEGARSGGALVRIAEPAEPTLRQLTDTLWPSSNLGALEPVAESAGPYALDADVPERRDHGDAGPRDGIPAGGAATGRKGANGPDGLTPRDLRTYLECPRKWFWGHSLSFFGLDHGLDGLARATYLRDVILAYSRRRSEGAGPSEALLEASIREVLERYGRSDRSDNPTSLRFSRYLPLPGTLEGERLEETDRELRSWVALDAAYLRAVDARQPPLRVETLYGCRDTTFGTFPARLTGRIGAVPIRLQPLRIDVCPAERSYLITLLGSWPREEDLTAPVLDDTAPEAPAVASISPAAAELWAHLVALAAPDGTPRMGVSSNDGAALAGALRDRTPAGVVMASRSGDHPLRGFCRADSPFLTATTLGRADGIVAIDAGRFRETLEAVERHLLTRVIDPLGRGAILRRPSSSGACIHCGDPTCPRRRDHG